MRRADLTASRRALGQNVEVATINYTPMGDFGAVSIERLKRTGALRSRQAPYDRWFKDALEPMLPPQVDFDQPVPPAVQFFDYVAEPVAAGAD